MFEKKEGQRRAEGGDLTLPQGEREDAPALGQTRNGRGRKGWNHPHTPHVASQLWLLNLYLGPKHAKDPCSGPPHPLSLVCILHPWCG